MAEPITIDEILAEMARCQKSSNHTGVTVSELVQQTGRCDQMIRADIRKAIASGTIECVREKRTGIDGVARSLPTYRVVAKGKGKK